MAEHEDDRASVPVNTSLKQRRNNQGKIFLTVHSLLIRIFFFYLVRNDFQDSSFCSIYSILVAAQTNRYNSTKTKEEILILVIQEIRFSCV